MDNSLLIPQPGFRFYFKEHPDYIFEIGSVTYNAIRYAAIAGGKSFSITPNEFEKRYKEGAEKLYQTYLLNKKDTVYLFYAASSAVNGQDYDRKKFTFGIKEYSYDTIGNVFHISINGKRVFVKGGNWGMSEYMLRCRGEAYDVKIKLHKEMNMNMIRNWIGSVTDNEFYEACDKYGIMV